jgi:hypothetical protein
MNRDQRPDFIALAENGVVGALNNGAGFDTPSVWSHFFAADAGWSSPRFAATIQFRDLNGDGFPDLLVRGAAVIYVALGDGKRFGKAQDWSHRFSDQQGWKQPAQYRSLSIARIQGRVGLAAGATSGIVFQEADPERCRLRKYRYLNNDGYSTLPNWHPERFASQLRFADFDGSGSDSAALVKNDGLYVALVRSVTD